MGIIINKVCCIDTNRILDNTNFNNNSIYDDNIIYSARSIESKNLPCSDINTNNETPKAKINSLSRLPISTKNVIRKQSGNPFEIYKIIKKLGNGTFGQVFEIKHKKTGILRAMKVIPKNNARPGFTDKDIIHEIMIMKNLDHPHVIKLYEFYIDDYNYYLINEFCSEGDLSEKMYKLRSLPEPIVKIIMAQIFNAVLYLNNRGIIHGDLKLENILVDSYLDNSKENEKGNFISSLIQDAKDVRSYIGKMNLKRSSTNHLNNFKNNLNNDNENKTENNNKKYLMNKINNDKNNKDDPRKKFMNNLIFLKKLKSKKDLDIFNDINNNNEDQEKNNNEEDQKTNNLPINDNEPKKNDIRPILKKDKKINCNSNSKKIKKVNIHKNSTINEETKEDTKNKENHFKLTRTKSYDFNKLKIKNFELKLIDFGCSKMFTQYTRTFEDTIGTLVYCSPEVLKNNYNQKCDIWSCGVIMYILLCGKYPFYGNTEEEITKKILIGNFNFDDKHFDNVSESAKDLIRKCLIHNKNNRITVKQALKHEFFAGELNINNIFEDEIDTKNILINLKNNSKKISKFYQIVLAYLSYNFADKEELKKLRNIFYKIDLNLDGKISKEELFLAYREAGIILNKKELEKIMKSIDFDGNGSIEYEEFIRVTLQKEQLFTDVNLKTAFDMFDLDKNGTISMSEILEVIGADKEISKNVIEQLKGELLKDGDEEIDFKHFKEIMLDLKE